MVQKIGSRLLTAEAWFRTEHSHCRIFGGANCHCAAGAWSWPLNPFYCRGQK